MRAGWISALLLCHFPLCLHAVGKAPHVLDNRTGQTPSCAP
ncbi:hypothetical protein [Aeromonas fluvialis]|nr:hypothetical protein [Aeromonas fluvialis]